MPLFANVQLPQQGEPLSFQQTIDFAAHCSVIRFDLRRSLSLSSGCSFVVATFVLSCQLDFDTVTRQDKNYKDEECETTLTHSEPRE